MIQRIQTIWLLLAAACGFISLNQPFYIGSIGAAPAERFTGMSNTLIMIFTVAAAIVALMIIFLYHNRPLQLKIGTAGLVISMLTILLYFVQAKKYDTGGIALFCVFAFAVPVFFILALRGIYKDEQMVKNADRLR